MRIKVSADFYLDEFLPKDIYERFRENGIWFIDRRLIDVAQFLRNHFNKPIVINNWVHEGVYEYSGFRPPDSLVGAKLSQHKFGRAMDLHFAGLDPEEVRKEIKNNESYFFQGGVRAVELDTPTWTHIDIRESKKIIWIPHK